MAKEIDRVRAQSALAVIKQHPGLVLFASTVPEISRISRPAASVILSFTSPIAPDNRLGVSQRFSARLPTASSHHKGHSRKARHRHSQKRTGRHIYLLIPHVVQHLFLVNLCQRLRT